jgi:hypothetical protein
VSAAFEVGLKDAGPGVGENAERVDAEEDGESGEAEEELSFGFHSRKPVGRCSIFVRSWHCNCVLIVSTLPCKPPFYGGQRTRLPALGRILGC